MTQDVTTLFCENGLHWKAGDLSFVASGDRLYNYEPFPIDQFVVGDECEEFEVKGVKA